MQVLHIKAFWDCCCIHTKIITVAFLQLKGLRFSLRIDVFTVYKALLLHLNSLYKELFAFNYSILLTNYWGLIAFLNVVTVFTGLKWHGGTAVRAVSSQRAGWGLSALSLLCDRRGCAQHYDSWDRLQSLVTKTVLQPLLTLQLLPSKVKLHRVTYWFFFFFLNANMHLSFTRHILSLPHTTSATLFLGVCEIPDVMYSKSPSYGFICI